jgi:hypothetical protein
MTLKAKDKFKGCVSLKAMKLTKIWEVPILDTEKLLVPWIGDQTCYDVHTMMKLLKVSLLKCIPSFSNVWLYSEMIFSKILFW